jgi:anti-anti-sigma factor
MHQGDISVQQANDVAIVMLRGEHDAHTAPSLRGRIETFISEGVPVVVDLTQTTFIDSSILRVLILARNGSQENRLGFAVCLDQDGVSAVRRVFEVVRADVLFPIFASPSEAIEKVLSDAGAAG